MTQNSFPMKQWHVEHMEKTIVRFVTGLSQDASTWERRQHKRYGGLTNTCRQIDYDIRHGVTNDEILSFLHSIRNHSSFAKIRGTNGSIERLNAVEGYFYNKGKQAPSFF